MEIIVTRQFKKPSYIIGSMTINGQWFCNTLEPPIGTDKETITSGSGVAIKQGRYRMRIVFSPKFQTHLPCLDNVPGRFGILVHAGNSVRDTKGCILVGKNTRPGKVLQSKDTLNTFINKLRKCERKREEVWIEVKD